MLSTDLQTVFDFQLSMNKKFACQWVEAGQHWYVCSSAFMCENTGEPDCKPQSYNKAPSNPVFEEDPSRIYPENCLEVLIEKLPVEFLTFLYTGEEIVAADGSKVLPLVCSDLPKNVYTLVYSKLKEIRNIELSLCLYIKTKMPILRITQDKSILYLIMAVGGNSAESVTIETNKYIYKASQWSDINKWFNKVERKEKMAIKDAEVKSMVEKTLGVTIDKLKFDPEKTGGENIAEEKAAKSESKAVSEKAPIYAQMEVKDETPTEEQGAAGNTKGEAAQQKRTRKKAEITRVQDLTRVIEQLGGTVPEDMSLEDAQKEIRQLRDLLTVASRRIANVSLAYIEKNAGAEAKLAAIRAAL